MSKIIRKKQLITDFTSGSIPKQLTRFMLPFMGSNALQVVYSLVDMIIVGRFVGAAGLSAVSQASFIIMFSTAFAMGFSNGGQTLIGQLIGAGRRDDLSKAIGTLFTNTILLSVIMTLLTELIYPVVLTIINIPPEAFDMASDYVVITGIGLLFVCGYNSVACVLRGMGDGRHPFIFILISSVMNLTLDILLTGVLGMGVRGAAYATTISQAVSFMISVAFLVKNKKEFYFDFRFKSFRITKGFFLTILRLGIPMALMSSAVIISMMVCNSFVNQVGVIASATFGIGLKIDDIANRLSQGIQFAESPMVAQNMGAGKDKRCRSIVYWSLLMTAIIFVIFTVILKTVGVQLFALFTDDAEVLDLAPVFIAAIVWGFPGSVMMRAGNGFLQGCGAGKMIIFASLMDGLLRAVLGYLIGIVGGMGFFGFVLGFGLAQYGCGLPGVCGIINEISVYVLFAG